MRVASSPASVDHEGEAAGILDPCLADLQYTVDGQNGGCGHQDDLTSNLVVATDVNAINVASGVRYVTIDLNGFSIRGGGTGSGDGISSFAFGLTVRNGTIENFGGDGVDAGATLQAEDLTVSSNNGRGINAGGPSAIRNVISTDNSADGVRISSGLVTGSVLSGNGGVGLVISSGTGAVSGGYSNNSIIFNTAGTVSGGVNLGGNLCGMTTTCP
jgi:hypothetical protein